MTEPTSKCCGFPEMGVCPDCPDPETVEWGKRNPPKWIEVPGCRILPFCGKAEAVTNE